MFPFLRNLVRGRRNGETIELLILIIFLFCIGDGIFWYILPLFTEDIVGKFSLIGLLLATPTIVSLLADVPMGKLSDKIGSKPLIVAALGMVILVMFAYTAIFNRYHLLLLLVWTGVIYTSIWVGSGAFVMKILNKKSRGTLYGIWDSVIGLGYAIGPLIAGFLYPVGTDNLFIFVGILCFLSFILSTKLKSRNHLKTFRADAGDFFINEFHDFMKLGKLGLVTAFLMIIVSFWDALVWMMEPLYAESLNVSVFEGGLLLSLFVLPTALFELFGGNLSDRFGRRLPLVVGLATVSIGIILFVSSKGLPLMALGSVLASVGIGLVSPSLEAMVADLTPHRKEGEFLGVFAWFSDIGYAVGPIVAGVLADISVGLPFVVTAGLIGLGILLSALFVPNASIVPRELRRRLRLP